MKISPKKYAKLLFDVHRSEKSADEKKGEVSAIANFLLKKRDQRKVKDIEFEFKKMLFESGESIPVLVQSAHLLREDQIKRIKEHVALEKGISPSAVEISTEIHRSLIGSLRISVGNEIIDRSMSSRISKLKRAFNI